MPYDILSANLPFALGEVQTSKRGQKFAPITVNGQAPLFQLTDLEHPVLAPFGCGVYQERGDETRLNLDVQLPEGSDLLAVLEGYDRYFEDQLKGLEVGSEEYETRKYELMDEWRDAYFERAKKKRELEKARNPQSGELGFAAQPLREPVAVHAPLFPYERTEQWMVLLDC